MHLWALYTKGLQNYISRTKDIHSVEEGEGRHCAEQKCPPQKKIRGKFLSGSSSYGDIRLIWSILKKLQGILS